MAGSDRGGSVYLQTVVPKSVCLDNWAAANCAALLTANAGQYATSNCKLPLFWFPCKQQYINVPTF